MNYDYIRRYKKEKHVKHTPRNVNNYKQQRQTWRQMDEGTSTRKKFGDLFALLTTFARGKRFEDATVNGPCSSLEEKLPPPHSSQQDPKAKWKHINTTLDCMQFEFDLLAVCPFMRWACGRWMGEEDSQATKEDVVEEEEEEENDGWSRGVAAIWVTSCLVCGGLINKQYGCEIGLMTKS